MVPTYIDWRSFEKPLSIRLHIDNKKSIKYFQFVQFYITTWHYVYWHYVIFILCEIDFENLIDF